jgi:hypothetical protein
MATKPPVSVRLPDSLRARVAAAAIAERRTFSNALRVLVEDGLDARDAKDTSRSYERVTSSSY